MSANAITLADIKSVDWSLKLGAIGQVVEGIDDVAQCIGIILTTPKGSDPLRPTFGADLWQYIDTPLDLAVPSIVREVTEAIILWEPRVRVISVSATPAAGGFGHLIVTLTWRLKLGAGGAASQSTVVAIPPTILGA